MNETLHANLPLEVFRKPIHFSSKHYHFQQATLKAGRKTADSSPSNEEDRETQAELQVQIKRIRYLNPYLYYVTEDVNHLKSKAKEDLILINRVILFQLP